MFLAFEVLAYAPWKTRAFRDPGAREKIYFGTRLGDVLSNGRFFNARKTGPFTVTSDTAVVCNDNERSSWHVLAPGFWAS